MQLAYNWACLARQHGARATVYPHPLDRNALSMPEWEDFDGEFPDVHDGDKFLVARGDAPLRCPCVRVALEGDTVDAAAAHTRTGDRRPLLRLLGVPPAAVRLEPFLVHRGCGYGGYFPLARALAAHDALVSPSTPIPAYLSGRPYLAQSVGGDLQFDCGRADDHGLVMTLAFAAARFLTFTNPHTVGMCRRLGFPNGLYLPLAIDDDRYSPGEGQARREWEAEHGPGVYVLSASRIDNAVKGNGAALLAALIRAARQRPALRYVFLNWGHSAGEFAEQVAASGVAGQFVFRKPVGKARLIDYYRSCDAVIDQFVYGYYGAAGLEAAAVGKPILMAHPRAPVRAPLRGGRGPGHQPAGRGRTGSGPGPTGGRAGVAPRSWPADPRLAGAQPRGPTGHPDPTGTAAARRRPGPAAGRPGREQPAGRPGVGAGAGVPRPMPAPRPDRVKQ